MELHKKHTDSGIEIQQVYTPLDLPDTANTNTIPNPGTYPYTRGVQKDMYRGKLWTMRQYAGFSTAQESNKRYHYLLSQGVMGLSVAFDLPTQIGYDADHALADGEVGKVCVSILNTWRGDQWTSCQTISTVLLTLCTLLCENPLFNEPGVHKGHSDINNYNKIIEYSNLHIAVCKIVAKKEGYYLPFFNFFEVFVKEHFKKNIDALLDYAEKKKTEFPDSLVLTTNLYSMKVTINYSRVIKHLLECKEMCNLNK